MIQVIQRVFNILECLRSDEEIGLDKLARTTKLNKGTLCNILKTLVSLGYVSKSGNGYYKISRKFFRLAYPLFRKDTIHKFSQKFSNNLADQTRESGVVATLDDSVVCIVAQAQFSRSLMVNVAIYNNLSLYHSVSGRILLSFLDDEGLSLIIEKMGYPGDEWDGISDMQKLKKAIDEIRDLEMSVMPNPDDEIKSFAVPVFDVDKKICASLGLTVPLSRLVNGNENMIVNTLRDNAKRFQQTIASESLQQSDWFNYSQNNDNIENEYPNI